ncbi:hypothetical protein A0H81_03839 [Grifola frondosa]|uniref:SET domain-containing protein n=1 Tax=Grifola frondosa TaxID=5627 RepID=A0A1C7MNE4_GRIFR|nr:hypothetical protein A0H81_03839 [Grifola frondosa]
MDSPTGLYLLPSLFNHSCDGNAAWTCIGEVMVIRATEHISAGTEITLPYAGGYSYVERHSTLKHFMLSGCDCWLCKECKEDLKDGKAAIQRRHELYTKLLKGPKYSLAELRTLEQQIAKTYSSSRGPVRPITSKVQHAIASKLIALDSPSTLREGIKEELKALKGFGYKLHASSSASDLPIAMDRLPSMTDFYMAACIMICLSHLFLRLDDDRNAAGWLKAAVWGESGAFLSRSRSHYLLVTNAAIGGGKELFMLIMGLRIEHAGLQEFALHVL